MTEPDTRLDPATRHARLWAAEDRILGWARTQVRFYHLDPVHLERLESACVRGDDAMRQSVLADVLEEVLGRSG